MATTDYQPHYETSQALVIGIDTYADPRLVPLGNAEADARSVSEVLAAPPYSFNVRQLLGGEATKSAILEALYDLRAAEPDDRVLFYFAGHGYTLTNQRGYETGYLACADTVPEKDFTALELNEVTALRDQTAAKHIAFVFDACFSGQALGLTRVSSVAADKLLLRRAYQVISAGAGDQTVADVRSMTGLLVEGLREAVGGSQPLTLNGLGLHIQKTMTAESKSSQIPQFGHLTHSQGGDYVFYAPPEVRPLDLLPEDLREGLSDDNHRVRYFAIAEAERLLDDARHGETVREVLDSMVVSDPDEEVRRRALAALRSSPPEHAAELAPTEPAVVVSKQGPELSAAEPTPRVVPRVSPSMIGVAAVVGVGLVVLAVILALQGVFGGGAAPPEEELTVAAPASEVEPAPVDEEASEAGEMARLDRPIVVGSKEFTEQLILGSMTVQLLEANGYEVDDQTGLGGTTVNREALEAGEIDVYWEYTGTALVNFLGVEEVITDPAQAFQMSADADAENGLAWLEPAEFNNTYTLMVRQETVDAGVTSISDLAEEMQADPNSFSLCTGAEFYARPDGFKGMEELYGFEFPEEGVVDTDYDLTYQALADGECEVSMGFATDGRIAVFNFTNLDDDLGFFPTYNPAPVLRQEVLDADPGVGIVLSRLGPTLDTATMTDLNKRVDIDEEDVDAVACDHLLQNGLVSECP